jgi:hypothetical protein
MRDFYFRVTFGRNLGWKHAQAKPADELQRYRICSQALSFLTITKNPYSWLLSLYKRPYHQYWSEKPDFETFLSRPWLTVGRENGPRAYASPVALWNKKNASFLQLGRHWPTLHIRYEDLLAAPEQIVDRICATFAYRRSAAQFQNYEQSTKDSAKDSAFYRAYYLAEEWRQELPAPAIRLINERLDDRLLEFFQYEKRTAD